MSAAIDLRSLARPEIQSLKAYDPGHDIPLLRQQFASKGGLLELGSNENPYGPSPAVTEALHAVFPLLHRYPDPSGAALKLALAKLHGVETSHLMLGNGSHELLMQLAQVFTGPGDEIVFSRFCFAVYPIAAQAAGASIIWVASLPETDDMPLGHDLQAMANAITSKTKLICMANPNNPTGTWYSTQDLEQFMQRVPASVLVLVDEAYIEYVTDPALVSATALQQRFPNLVVSRTFSKAHGLAGLRAGYLLADAAVVSVMEPIRESFNLNAMALAAAQASLADQDHLNTVRQATAVEREWLDAELHALGLSVLPSQTNFLLVRMDERTEDVEQALFQRGIMVRPMGGYGLHGYLRITVSVRADNERLLQAIKEILACM